MSIAAPVSREIFEFEKIVTPKTRVKIKGQWIEKGGEEFYICLGCRHWLERGMATNSTNEGLVITCNCGCHDLHYTEITEESCSQKKQ